MTLGVGRQARVTPGGRMMAVMADRTVRDGPERSRIKTITKAALNADKTVEQVEDVLDGLSNTMKELNSSLAALNATVERMESGLDIWTGRCPA